ncbi:MAG: AAA family ATPase [Planctomycetes bacterium]|nr:AAA family ATPase [Planctomycetota bacterium]
MTVAPRNPEQEQVVSTQAELSVVLGGAGVGKTTSALAAAHAHLERVADSKPHDRVLFLSFSRSSVARIASRAGEILGRRGSDLPRNALCRTPWQVACEGRVVHQRQGDQAIYRNRNR